jgi:hypothetical protein
VKLGVTGEGVTEGGVGVVPFAVTGRETSIGLNGRDTTEERSRGDEEGDITDRVVDDYTEGCGNEGLNQRRG